MGFLKAFICAILIIGGIFGIIWLGLAYPEIAAILLASAFVIVLIIGLTVALWFNFF